ncbi:hypothetical protein PPL_04744 [Heterostelium album PN500]|uniref:Uncharacterized protein n=1 Tax=Heterostelium pallidum (strain ATCC 26659 / Pp 5 / PN500) TaxID=670386 RepID=D3B8F1_HETP5|nr:hypothetical protein PPL_04744 [Heterostelium album PN500]EFA82319.1 hypothetical protein PPL_04744 [Heterostelium album PN500]|eukprot:XP_020434436.1 hypothetical protein PPL_04744 [Heterostelium album PN500]
MVGGDVITNNKRCKERIDDRHNIDFTKKVSIMQNFYSPVMKPWFNICRCQFEEHFFEPGSDRVSLMILTCIRFLKLYMWEQPFIDRGDPIQRTNSKRGSTKWNRIASQVLSLCRVVVQSHYFINTSIKDASGVQAPLKVVASSKRIEVFLPTTEIQRHMITHIGTSPDIRTNCTCTSESGKIESGGASNIVKGDTVSELTTLSKSHYPKRERNNTQFVSTTKHCVVIKNFYTTTFILKVLQLSKLIHKMCCILIQHLYLEEYMKIHTHQSLLLFVLKQTKNHNHRSYHFV